MPWATPFPRAGGFGPRLAGRAALDQPEASKLCTPQEARNLACLPFSLSLSLSLSLCTYIHAQVYWKMYIRIPSCKSQSTLTLRLALSCFKGCDSRTLPSATETVLFLRALFLGNDGCGGQYCFLAPVSWWLQTSPRCSWCRCERSPAGIDSHAAKGVSGCGTGAEESVTHAAARKGWDQTRGWQFDVPSRIEVTLLKADTADAQTSLNPRLLGREEMESINMLRKVSWVLTCNPFRPTMFGVAVIVGWGKPWCLDIHSIIDTQGTKLPTMALLQHHATHLGQETLDERLAAPVSRECNVLYAVLVVFTYCNTMNNCYCMTGLYTVGPGVSARSRYLHCVLSFASLYSVLALSGLLFRNLNEIATIQKPHYLLYGSGSLS